MNPIVPSKPRAIVFDLDGTLIDSAIAITAAVNTLLARRGLPATDPKKVRNWVSLGAADVLRNVLGQHITNLSADIDEFRSIYRAIKPDPNDLFPHALTIVTHLAAADYALGICTNKPEDLAQLIIKGVGLEPYIQSIVGGREGMPAKPDPAPIFEVLRQLGVPASEAIYVGDSEVDAEAAKAAGLPFLLVTFGYAIGKVQDIPCAGRIDDFRDLEKWWTRQGLNL